MNLVVDYNKETKVAYVDVCETPSDACISVVNVSDSVGFNSSVVARIDTENQVIFGLIIEDYPAFKRELLVKYHTARVHAIIEMILRTLRAGIGVRSHRDHSAQPALC